MMATEQTEKDKVLAILDKNAEEILAFRKEWYPDFADETRTELELLKRLRKQIESEV